MVLNNFTLYIKNPIISYIKIVIKSKILPSLKVNQSYDIIESEKIKKKLVIKEKDLGVENSEGLQS